jgi:hypothetical protein
MSQQALPADPAPPPAQVWLHLATDVQEQAIRLMAQLAFNLVTAQLDVPKKEYTRDLPSQQTKDRP